MPLKDPQKRKQYNKEYYQTHREQIRIIGIIWRQKNKVRLAKKKTEYWFKVRKQKSKIWKKCIKCNKDIFGTKKKKYCDNCRKEIMKEILDGNQYWKLVKNRPRGENSPVWRGGITFWKKRIWDSPKYKKWRSDVFKRDNWTCQECGIKSGNGKAIILEAHHLVSFHDLLRKYNIHSREEADKCEELWNISLGQTLCFKCHQPTKNGNPNKKRK